MAGKALKHVHSTQILAHRVVWSLVFILFLVSVQRRWKEVNSIIPFSRNVPRFLFTSFLLGTNWLIYIWAINTNQIVEASLGYFVNPLVNVCLGIIFFASFGLVWVAIIIYSISSFISYKKRLTL